MTKDWVPRLLGLLYVHSLSDEYIYVDNEIVIRMNILWQRVTSNSVSVVTECFFNDNIVIQSNSMTMHLCMPVLSSNVDSMTISHGFKDLVTSHCTVSHFNLQHQLNFEECLQSRCKWDGKWRNTTVHTVQRWAKTRWFSYYSHSI